MSNPCLASVTVHVRPFGRDAVLLDVTDERKIYLGSAAWQQDGIEVRVDGRPDPARSAGRDEHSAMVAISPAHQREDMIVDLRDGAAGLDVTAVGIPTPKGHAYEIAIPVSYIEALQGANWQRLRLNIAVDDFDDPTGPLAQLWRQPDWRDGTNFPGSGTFQRR